MELMVAEDANWFDAKQLEALTKGKPVVSLLFNWQRSKGCSLMGLHAGDS